MLKLDWCSYEAAKYAVEHWHYSRKMNKGKSCYIGVWEEERFIGTVIFGTGSGASTNGARWGLAERFQVAELVRVALRRHNTPVTRIISIACRMVSKQSPGLKMLISYADPEQGHHGGIYQGAGWIYVGRSSPDFFAVDHAGRKWHSRSCSASGKKVHFGRATSVLKLSDAKEIVKTQGKYTYLLPLCSEVKKRIATLAKPYPKRAKQAMDAYPAFSGGAAPTRTLQSSNNQAAPTLHQS